MKLKLKSKSLVTIDKKIYEKLAQGWIVIKEQRQNFWGKWIVVMEKK